MRWMLVSGAASGIGLAIARTAASEGYGLLLIDRSSGDLKAAADELAGSTQVETAVADVTDLDSLTRAIARRRDRRGVLSAVAHSAGIEVLGTIEEIDPEDWLRCIQVNLTGTFNVARASIGELRQSRGAMTLVASDAGITGAQGYAAYCASKHGVVGLMRAMALDYGPVGVRVNAVAPSFVETPMADRIFEGYEGERDFYRTTVPLGRFASPMEVASAVLHLSGSESSYTTGMVYRIDGGSTAGYFRPPSV